MRNRFLSFAVMVALGMVAGFAASSATRKSQAAFMEADGSATHRFHGYCRCGCSSVPNCNTSADCGGGACSATISCC